MPDKNFSYFVLGGIQIPPDKLQSTKVDFRYETKESLTINPRPKQQL
jgi:hypothetical protein